MYAFAGNKIKNLIIRYDLTTRYDLHVIPAVLQSHVFSSNKIDNVYFSAPVLELDAFKDAKVKNFYIDLNKLKEVSYFSLNPPELEIDEMFCAGTFEPESSEADFFYEAFINMYRSKIHDFSIDNIIENYSSLKDINKAFMEQDKLLNTEITK